MRWALLVVPLALLGALVVTQRSDSGPSCTAEVSSGESISSKFNDPASGAVVCVHAGTYDEHVVLTRNNATLQGYPGEARPLVRPTAVIPSANESLRIGGDFQHVSGIDFQGSVNACSNCQGMVVWFMTASNDSSLIDSDVSLNRIGSGIFLTGTRDRVERVSSHDNFDEANYNGTQAHGFYVQGTNHVLVNNLAYNHAEGWGFQFYPNGAGAGTVMAQNTMEDDLLGCVVLYSSVRIVNNICAGDDGFVDSSAQNGCVVTDNIVWPGPANVPSRCTSARNLIADPRFSGPDDFRLLAGSPAIGYADPLWSYTPDHAGNSRDGDPDVGAYEFVPPAPPPPPEPPPPPDPPPPPPNLCADGLDNDLDGLLDLEDPGCLTEE